MANTTLGYESAYTGAEIDEAVGAVLGGNGTSSLSARMTAVEGDVGTLGTTVGGHTSDIGTLSGKVTALEGINAGSRLTTAEGNIATLQALAAIGYRLGGFVSPANTWLMQAVNMTCYVVMNPTARSWHDNVQGMCYLPPTSYTPGSSAPQSVDGWTAVDITSKTSQGIPVLFGFRNGNWITHPLPYSINEGQTVSL